MCLGKGPSGNGSSDLTGGAGNPPVSIFSASLHSDRLCEGDVCAGSKRNEEPWQPRNCRAGRITAGIPGASSSGDGKGIGYPSYRLELPGINLCN